MGDSMLGSGGAAFKLLVALAALVGVAIQIQVSADPLGKLNLLSYFTIQSNIIVGVVFLASAVKTLGGGEPGRALAALERSARVWIWMTGLAFHFLLSRVWHPVGIQALANFLVHYAVPAGALLSWIVFERKGGHRIGDIVVIAAYPLLYAAASLLRGSLDGRLATLAYPARGGRPSGPRRTPAKTRNPPLVSGRSLEFAHDAAHGFL